MSNMENTYVENTNVELQYPYAAKDTNQLLYCARPCVDDSM